MTLDTFFNLPEEKRKKIIEKGVEIFTNYSYAAASTNQLTKELGISKGSLFSYFDSKKSFYLYLLDYCIETLMPIKQQIKSTEFYEILFESMENKMNLYTSGHKEQILFVNRVSKEDNIEVKPEKDKVIQKYMIKAQQESMNVLRTAISTLPIEENKKNEKLLHGMTMYINTIMGRYLAMYKDTPEDFYKNQENIKKEIKEYLDILLYGVMKNEHD